MRIFRNVIIFTALASCAPILSDPVNEVRDTSHLLDSENESDWGENLIFVSLSGGGTRAAAFSYGFLDGLNSLTVEKFGKTAPATDSIGIISGVSGGSIAAAHFGLFGADFFTKFKTDFLYRDVEKEALRTGLNPWNAARLLKGGVNNDRQFPRWLDENLFHGASLDDLSDGRGPLTLINATDIEARNQFIFEPEVFEAFCSNYDNYPIANAVAASSAVPFIFAPVALRTYSKDCEAQIPDWARDELETPSGVRSIHRSAQALKRYAQDPDLNYIKLLDGGLTDNLGIHGLTRLLIGNRGGIEPLNEDEALRVNQILILIVNAGTAPQPEIGAKLQSPKAGNLAKAASQATIDFASGNHVDELSLIADNWEQSINRFRCNSDTTRPKCANVQVHIETIELETLTQTKNANLTAVPTRFSLKRTIVDQLIAIGRKAALENVALSQFVDRGN